MESNPIIEASELTVPRTIEETRLVSTVLVVPTKILNENITDKGEMEQFYVYFTALKNVAITNVVRSGVIFSMKVPPYNVFIDTFDSDSTKRIKLHSSGVSSDLSYRISEAAMTLIATRSKPYNFNELREKAKELGVTGDFNGCDPSRLEKGKVLREIVKVVGSRCLANLTLSVNK